MQMATVTPGNNQETTSTNSPVDTHLTMSWTSGRDIPICSICHEDLYVISKGLAILDCNHKFHLCCVGHAFTVKGKMECPICRNVEISEWYVPKVPNEYSEDEEFDEFDDIVEYLASEEEAAEAIERERHDAVRVFTEFNNNQNPNNIIDDQPQQPPPAQSTRPTGSTADSEILSIRCLFAQTRERERQDALQDNNQNPNNIIDHQPQQPPTARPSRPTESAADCEILNNNLEPTFTSGNTPQIHLFFEPFRVQHGNNGADILHQQHQAQTLVGDTLSWPQQLAPSRVPAASSYVPISENLVNLDPQSSWAAMSASGASNHNWLYYADSIVIPSVLYGQPVLEIYKQAQDGGYRLFRITPL